MNRIDGIRFRLTLVVLLFIHFYSLTQTASLKGYVKGEEGVLPFVEIILKEINLGTTSNMQGEYAIQNIPAGRYTLEIRSAEYITITDTITFESGQTITRDFQLSSDVLNFSQVVVTGSRLRVDKHNSPVIVHTIDSKLFEFTQALNVADGLNFSPGLRVENNCQNCGFTQLRMNGLDGPYSQVLINSRPVFSALAGVYGLELLPSNMVDRIEVVRGGGSVMYGGNAIAGTVNIITKEPVKNTFEVGINQALINGEASDRTVNFNGSIVTEDLKKGITFFGFNRNRDWWDANGDGFSEIVKLQNNTFGFDAFYDIIDRDQLKLRAYYINEFRRGGNKFDLFPHQTDVTEQLRHNIVSTNLSFDHLSKDKKHKISTYGSLQHVDRESYYGGGGQVLTEEDSLTSNDVLAINAYGNSRDISAVGGLQYNFFNNSIFTLTAGSEYIFNDVIDEMPGYGRLIDQQVATWGTFTELEIKPIDKLTFLVGGRFDQLSINGEYNLEQESFRNSEDISVLIPRASVMYKLKENFKLRASFAQGYRGPQAFDEDLHIETVGGAARFIRLGDNLQVERSNSATFSVNYDKIKGKTQLNIVAEGFYTQLENPFIFADQEELPNSVAVITKRNGDGASVAGINLEANMAIGSKLLVQSGATIQQATYDTEEELWAPENPNANTPATTTKRLLRTPNAYGYFSLVYTPLKVLSIAYSGVVTGKMDVAHVIDADTEQTVLKRTQSFFENNIKLSYTFRTADKYSLKLFGGIQNILNSYQDDFDLGADRDAGYVYGPLSPRTFFMGLSFGLE